MSFSVVNPHASSRLEGINGVASMYLRSRPAPEDKQSAKEQGNE
jgi:hypothetical protein